MIKEKCEHRWLGFVLAIDDDDDGGWREVRKGLAWGEEDGG